MPPTIRPASPSDAPAILRIYMQSAVHHRDLEPDRYTIPSGAPILDRYSQPASATSTTLVAVHDGQIVGFAEIRLQPPADPMHRATMFCHVLEIAIAEDRRSAGVGRALMSAAEEWGRSAGAEFMSLEYLASNTRAASFYERLGFRAASVTAIKRIE